MPLTAICLGGPGRAASITLLAGLLSTFAGAGDMARADPAPDLPAVRLVPVVSPAAAAGGSPADPYPAQDDGRSAGTGGRYFYSRWDENWTFLRDPAKATDPFDPLKYIPLTRDGSAYLTLSGSARLGYFGLTNAVLEADAPALQAGLFRADFGADLHLAPWFRAYGELGTGGIGGRNYSSVVAVDRSALFVRQAFAEVFGPLFGASTGLIVGRQDFTDGPQQVFSTRDIPNLQFEFNGARAYANWPLFRLDAVAFHSTYFGSSLFNSPLNSAEKIAGLNTSFVLRDAGATHLFLDPFYFRYVNTERPLGGIKGKEEISAYGARLTGDAGPLKVDWVGQGQSGSFAGRNVQAFTAYTQQSYEFAGALGKPRLGVRADVASGGGAYSRRGTIHDADYLFGSAPYLSYGLLLTGQNLIDLAPTLEFQPLEQVKLRAEYVLLWRYSTNDAIYNALKVPYAGTQNARGRRTGDLLRLRADWTINPHLSVNTELEYLNAAAGVKRAGLASSVFSSAYVALRF